MNTNGTHPPPRFSALVTLCFRAGRETPDAFVRIRNRSVGGTGSSAGQLEQEIAQNAWLTVAADPDVLFETPAEARLPAAMKLLGIDFSRLSEDVGHA